MWGGSGWRPSRCGSSREGTAHLTSASPHVFQSHRTPVRFPEWILMGHGRKPRTHGFFSGRDQCSIVNFQKQSSFNFKIASFSQMSYPFQEGRMAALGSSRLQQAFRFFHFEKLSFYNMKIIDSVTFKPLLFIAFHTYTILKDSY